MLGLQESVLFDGSVWLSECRFIALPQTDLARICPRWSWDIEMGVKGGDVMIRVRVMMSEQPKGG